MKLIKWLIKKIRSFIIDKKNIAIMLAFCYVILLITGSISIAKYVDGKQNHNGSSVSVYINDVEIITESINISKMSPGTSQTIDFSVTNYKEDLVCEVALEYDIIITTENNLPLKITVIKSNEEVKREYPTPSIDTLTWSNGNMKANVRDTHNYKINIEWPYEENDYYY